MKNASKSTHMTCSTSSRHEGHPKDLIYVECDIEVSERGTQPHLAARLGRDRLCALGPGQREPRRGRYGFLQESLLAAGTLCPPPDGASEPILLGMRMWRRKKRTRRPGGNQEANGRRNTRIAAEHSEKGLAKSSFEIG
ncbi:hypothetical protein MLD38_003045 [Melastoma candidum]|uniref:Uncharacterized protein n=1 Tax=Melastoma candidum TaxID=119954 RepID=A0ACB9S552_9MYRT|nr:hypothetical protein MLD38_003045 [Melastoma candidum]